MIHVSENDTNKIIQTNKNDTNTEIDIVKKMRFYPSVIT